jgi:hypothetical protein
VASCRYCGALLSADESVRRGYGRDCAREHRQPYGSGIPRRFTLAASLARATRADISTDEARAFFSRPTIRQRHPDRFGPSQRA